MRISEAVYFAPNLRFAEVDLTKNVFPDQLALRIRGFYIQPATECVKMGHAFAAGVLLVASIDALAAFNYGSHAKVGHRFRKFANEHLPSFTDPKVAGKFYREFRNGLVHNARIKQGGQFEIGQGHTISFLGPLLIVDPGCLADEIAGALDTLVERMKQDNKLRQQIVSQMKEEFKLESASV